MAIIRFLDESGTCYQIDTFTTPVLIALTQAEKETLQSTQNGECLSIINNQLPETQIKSIQSALNTKNDFKVIIKKEN